MGNPKTFAEELQLHLFVAPKRERDG